MSVIIDLIYDEIWTILIQGPLNLIAVFGSVISYLSSGLVIDLLFGSRDNLSLNNIPVQFWLFALLALFFVIILFIVNYMTFLFKEELNAKERVIKALKNTCLAVVFCFMIPFGFIVVIYLVDFFQQAITTIVGGGSSANMADILYNLGNINWDGSTDNIKSGYAAPSDIHQWNLIVELIGVLFMLYALLMLSLALVKTVCEIFFLFVISPMICASMVQDNGQRLKTWNEIMIGKMAASLGAVMGYGFFGVFIVAFNTMTQDTFSSIERMLLMLLIELGAGMFAMNAPAVLATFIGQAVGLEEGRAMMGMAKHVGNLALGGLGAAKMLMGMKKVAQKPKKPSIFSKFRNAPNRNADGSLADGDGATGESVDGGPNNANDKGISENMAKANAVRMRRSGIPGWIGKITRAGVGTAHGVKSVFSKQSWKNAGVIMKNMASTAGGVVIGNTVSQWKAKQQVSKVTAETAYEQSIKSGKFNNIKYIKSETDIKTLIDNYEERFQQKDKKWQAKINDYKEKGMLNKAGKIENKIRSKNIKIREKIDSNSEKVIAKTERINSKKFNKIQKNIEKNK